MSKIILVLLLLTAGRAEAWITTAFCREQAQLYKPSLASVQVGEEQPHITSIRAPVAVPLPKIQWTVPGMKRGWQDAAGTWWDEDGIRNGPPLNFWRQRADERAFAKDTMILEAVLEASCLQRVDLSGLSLQVTSPLLHKKLLGEWAPIVRNGQKVGTRSSSADLLEVPYKISIARSGGIRSLGNPTAYGTLDAHFNPGEVVCVTVMETVLEFVASKGNQVQDIGKVNGKEPLAIGNISYLSDYLLIMKDQDDCLREFWTRAVPVRSGGQCTDGAAHLRAEFEMFKTGSKKETTTAY